MPPSIPATELGNTDPLAELIVGRAERRAARPPLARALLTLQLGAAGVVLAALPYKSFELDRFFVPKELLLHLVAALAAWWCLAPGSVRAVATASASLSPRRVLADRALAAFLALGAASAALATNPWLAWRALAISVSGALLFWTGRALARTGAMRALVGALAGAVALAAATSLLQAYGVESEYFSLNRAPGGTFGNRNFVAHVCALGAPLLVWSALSARRATGVALATVGVAVVAAALVLSRSRGAWLAAAVSAAPMALALTRASRLPRGAARLTPRLALLGAGAALAAAGALALPNTLEWKSDSPYLDSVKGMADYRGGSGRGRLVQYGNSARMAMAQPLLGVGPGNWPVRYPRWAAPDDPSLTDDGMTANPWPSSDWVAILSERGVPAFLALGAVMLALAATALRGARRATTRERALAAATLGAVLAATLVVGAFDAVLLLAAPAMLAWPALGALSATADEDHARAGARGARGARGDATDGVLARLTLAPRALRLAVAAFGLVAVARAAAQSGAMAAFDARTTGALRLAVRLDPGSYRVRMRAATALPGRRCDVIRTHAGAARALFPEARAPKRLLAQCGTRRR